MKKAFTLIELLVTLVLSLIFFQFILEFKLNFISELQNLKKENELVKNAYRLSQNITKGFSHNSQYHHPMISIKDLNGTISFRSNNYTNILGTKIYFNETYSINTDDEFFIFKTLGLIFLNTYSYDKYLVTSNVNISEISSNDDIYKYTISLRDKTDENIKLENYLKLVYAK